MDHILARLDQTTLTRLRNSSIEAQKMETKWDGKVEDLFRGLERLLISALEQDVGIPQSLIHKYIEDLLVQQSFEVAIKAARIAQSETEVEERAPTHRLGPPAIKLPRSLRSLMELYDKWRKGKYTPNRPRKIAQRVAKAYLQKVKDVWARYSEDFRTGEVANQDEVRKKIRDLSDATTSRTKTIVRTETTNYYNQGRQEIYDASPDVTHYLFLAIRDKGTTRWCSPKTLDGKRGRHGLVYAKGDPLLAKERPACHYNCRSEIVPLTPANPSHLKLIKDRSIQRRNVECYPLLPGWRAA